MSTTSTLPQHEISALLFCPTSSGKPGDGKGFSISIEKDAAGFSVKTKWGKADMNPLPQGQILISGGTYDEALRYFFQKYHEKLSQSVDPYAVKTESIPPAVRVHGERLAGLLKTSKGLGAPEDWLIERLNELVSPDRIQKHPVLLDGPQGTGKTYAAREFGIKAGFSTVQEVAGHSGVEAIDLLGSFLPIGDGSYVWTDGPVTAAYRAASEGRKALLLIDEVYRIGLKHRNVLLNALVPHRFPDGKEYYMLRAGRVKPGSVVDGVGKTEMIAAPVQNLSVIGTTNAGSKFTDIEVDDPAAKERWHIVHVKMDESAQRRVMEKYCDEQKLPTKFAEAVLQLSRNTKILNDDEFLEHALSPRLNFRLLAMVGKPTRAGFELAAKEFVATVVGRMPDGDLIKEQERAYEKAIQETISKVGL